MARDYDPGSQYLVENFLNSNNENKHLSMYSSTKLWIYSTFQSFDTHSIAISFYTGLHRLWCGSCHPKCSCVIRFVKVINVVSWSFPKLRDHFVEQPGLLWIDENVSTQSSLATSPFFVHFLVSSAYRTNPPAPMQAKESLRYTLDGLTFARPQWEFGNCANGLAYIWTIRDLQTFQSDGKAIDGRTRRWG